MQDDNPDQCRHSFFPLKPLGKRKLSSRTCVEGYRRSSGSGSGWEVVDHGKGFPIVGLIHINE